MQSQEARERSKAEQSGTEEKFFIQQQIQCVSEKLLASSVLSLETANYTKPGQESSYDLLWKSFPPLAAHGGTNQFPVVSPL